MSIQRQKGRLRRLAHRAGAALTMGGVAIVALAERGLRAGAAKA